MALTQDPIFPKIVGIVNVTPDSFSDGGLYRSSDDAIRKAFSLTEDGADIIDIGGESTGANSRPIPLEEEWERLEPVLKVIGRELIISVDTFKAEIAKRALDLGAKIINDISALRFDGNMAEVVARANCKVVLMHSKESGDRPHVSDSTKSYKDVIVEVSNFLSSRVQYSLSSGIKSENIILDPGLGMFLSKDANYSWELLRRLEEFASLKLPLFIGVSRKSFLKSVEETTICDRDPLSALLAVHLARNGVGYIRTHNVKLTKEFLKTWNKLTVAN